MLYVTTQPEFSENIPSIHFQGEFDATVASSASVCEKRKKRKEKNKYINK